MPHDEIAQFFNNYAQDFNAIYGRKKTIFNTIINKLFRKSMRLRFEKTIEECSPIEGKSVIDIGCGPGHYGITLAKRGAVSVFAIDFSQSMIDIAVKNAEQAGVQEKCTFIVDDFLKFETDDTFDYAIVMGFMDYVAKPGNVIEKVISLTGEKALFSFPDDGGILAWQRKIRYKKKCDLYMYKYEMIQKILESAHCKHFDIQKISRDFFVSVSME